MNYETLKTVGQFHISKGYQIFHLQDDSGLSSLQYKVIQNEKPEYIIPCRMIAKDYEKELIFMTELYRELEGALLYMTVLKSMKAINDLVDAFMYIEKKDYLDISNIVLEEKSVLYNLQDNKIGLLYIPLSQGKEYHDFYLELIHYLRMIGEKTKLADYQKWKIFMHDMDKKEHTLEEISLYLKSMLMGDKGKKDAALKSVKKNEKGNIYIRLKGSGDNNKNIFHIDMDRYVIGRIPALVEGSLPMFPTVSSQHCEFTRCEDGYEISDLSSSNGTFVNHVRVKPGEKRKLQHGDVVNIAELSFVVEVKEKT